MGNKVIGGCGLFLAGILALASAAVYAQSGAAPAAAPGFAQIPNGKDTDLKFYPAGGNKLLGAQALARMPQEAGLILWLAGNQFFAMDDVVQAFQKLNPRVSVGLITLPPGLIADAILAGGWRYEGKDYPGRPDVYASVNLGHLQKLRQAGLMDSYATYMHNEMQIMVAKGNPKRVLGIGDLARADVRTSMPNPVNEGIMQFYARKVLERHGIWQQVSGGRECYSCQTTANNWFTAVHHRETPDRIRQGTADAGIVWKTEVIEAVREGAPVEGVQLPPADSLRDEVAYAIGPLRNSPRAGAAAAYLNFLVSAEGQAVYARFGFVSGTADELRMKPIP